MYKCNFMAYAGRIYDIFGSIMIGLSREFLDLLGVSVMDDLESGRLYVVS